MKKKKEMISDSGGILPDAIVEDILSRLTVKPLSRFRCVSKSWNTLIRNEYFVDMHLNRSKKNTTNLKLVVEMDEFQFSDSRSPVSAVIDELDLSVDICFKGRVSGSCNGLLLLWDFVPELYLINPSTGECKKLQDSFYKETGPYYSIQYGFGYDENSKDYKVVRIRSDVHHLHAIRSLVTVYSLRADSWRRIPITDHKLLRHRGPFPRRLEDGVFVNGALHWEATHSGEKRYIIAYDIQGETFHEVPLHTQPKRFIKLAALDGKLCWTDFSDFSETRWCLWLMRDYGFVNSWEKLFSIEKILLTDPYSFRPLCFTKEGASILLYDGNLHLYNLKDKRLKKVYNGEETYEWGYAGRATTYTESLVELKG